PYDRCVRPATRGRLAWSARGVPPRHINLLHLDGYSEGRRGDRPSVAHVDHHVVNVRVVEDEIPNPEVGGADPRGGVLLFQRVVRKVDADRGPRGHGETGAVVRPGTGRGPDVRLADLMARELRGLAALVARVHLRTGHRPEAAG